MLASILPVNLRRLFPKAASVRQHFGRETDEYMAYAPNGKKVSTFKKKKQTENSPVKKLVLALNSKSRTPTQIGLSNMVIFI